MRGLTEEELSLLRLIDAADKDPRKSKLVTQREREMREELISRGCVSRDMVEHKYAFRRPLTHLGRLAIRIHAHVAAILGERAA